MASLDEVLSSMPDMGGEEDSALDFLIDEHMRIITVPDHGVVLGVEGDKDVNRVRFRMNRYYHGSDLSEFQIRINYQNADGDRNYFTVLEKTVKGDAFSFIWTVAADATAAKGAVQFVVNCFTADSDGVVQKAYHTTLGLANVLEGLDPYEGGDIPEIVDYLTHLKNDLTIYSGTLVTGAEQSAAAASNSAGEAAKAEQSSKSYANAAEASATAAASSAKAAAKSAAEAKAVVGTDKTLTMDGAPADAKATGDALNKRYTLTKEDIAAVLGFTPTKITAGTEDLTAGISPLETGTVYLLYEETPTTPSVPSALDADSTGIQQPTMEEVSQQ